MQEDEEPEDPIYKKVITDTSDNMNKKMISINQTATLKHKNK